MLARDLVSQTLKAVVAHRLRSLLTMLGIMIGIASVILLTSIGEGTRRYILAEFMQFGSNIIQIQPGKVKTSGPVGAMGGTTNPLTLDDVVALKRLPGVERVVPTSVGTARVESTDRGRDVFVQGATADGPELWKFGVKQGVFLPAGDPRRGAAVAVLGPKLKRELFGDGHALGEYVRIGGERYLVIGIMEPKGYMLNFDLDDMCFIPIARAQQLFNRRDLWEINILFSTMADQEAVKERVRRTLVARHRGEEDFTIVTQQEMLATLDNILKIINYAIGGIGAISLVVGAIGILTMMWISVNERTAEIGLAKALGATPNQILALYLGEAAILSTLGGICGLAAAFAVSTTVHVLAPRFPLSTPFQFIVLALAVSLGVGLLSGVLPARRAAALDPIEALAAE